MLIILIIIYPIRVRQFVICLKNAPQLLPSAAIVLLCESLLSRHLAVAPQAIIASGTKIQNRHLWVLIV